MAVVAASFSAKAQLYVGGNAGLTVIAADGGTGSGWGLSPEVGYNFNNNMAVGVGVNFGGSFEKEAPVTFSADPYFRYFFVSGKNVRLFGDAILSIGALDKQFIWGVNVSPGLAFSVGKRWSFVTHLASIGWDVAKTGGAFSFNLLLNPRVGFFYNF